MDSEPIIRSRVVQPVNQFTKAEHAVFLIIAAVLFSIFFGAYCLSQPGGSGPEPTPPSTWADERHREIDRKPITDTQAYYEHEKTLPAHE